MIFLYLNIAILTKQYSVNQASFQSFLSFQRISYILENVENSFYKSMGIGPVSGTSVNFTFPLLNDSAIKNHTAQRLSDFINDIFKSEAYTNISMNVSNTTGILNQNEYSYKIDSYRLHVFKTNNTLSIENEQLTNLTIRIFSDANFTYAWTDQNTSISYFTLTIQNSSSVSWNMQKNQGFLNISFNKSSPAGYLGINFTQSDLVIDGSALDFINMGYMNLTIDFGNIKVRPDSINTLTVKDYIGVARAEVII